MAISPPKAPGWRLEGVVSLLLTPFRETGAIDWHAYDQYLDWQVAHRPQGIFAVCGSSEMHWLERNERVQLARRAVSRSRTIPVVATANLGPDRATHQDDIVRMADTGVAAVVLVPPPGISGDRARYRDYLFELVAGAPCPVILYEWPMVPHHLMDAALFGELAGQVAGIKDTTCTYEGIWSKQQVAGRAVVYQANHPFMLDALQMGVRGLMAITSTVAPAWLLRLWHGFNAGEDVHGLHRDVVVLDTLLAAGYPATAKHLAARLGLPFAMVTRAPSQPAPAAIRALDAWLAAGVDLSSF
jgi:4-hydroxy-tetrahydrodipicolinate synthase